MSLEKEIIREAIEETCEIYQMDKSFAEAVFSQMNIIREKKQKTYDTMKKTGLIQIPWREGLKGFSFRTYQILLMIKKLIIKVEAHEKEKITDLKFNDEELEVFIRKTGENEKGD